MQSRRPRRVGLASRPLKGWLCSCRASVFVANRGSDDHPATRSHYGIKSFYKENAVKLTISRLASYAGVNLETVRFYEKIGIMPEPGRTPGGHRVYSDEHRRRLTFVRRARELGFSLDDVRALLKLAQPNSMSCNDVEHIASAHLAQVRAKIADLTKLEGLLSETVSQCGAEGTILCPVIDLLGGEQPLGGP